MNPIRVSRASFPDSATIFDLDSQKELEALRKNEPCFESQNEIYLVKPGLVFRYMKPGLPTILETKEVTINPDSCSVKVELAEHELIEFCRREHLFCFSTKDTLILAVDSLVLWAKKEGVRHE